MQYVGESISLFVAVLWTVAALVSEIGSKRLGAVMMNLWRIAVATLVSAIFLWVVFGVPLPLYASTETWLWLTLSGVIGYFLGDWCLFSSYIVGQQLSWKTLLAMAVTLAGIAITVFHRGDGHKMELALPLRGVLFGLGAALGQGIGLVLSKIGLDHYTADVPAEVLPQVASVLPFGANAIRALAATVCFLTWVLLRGEGRQALACTHDRKGMAAMLIAVFFGPFIGVGLSLMALEYTAAGIASTLMALTPILILLPSKWMFHQPITWKAVMGAVISCIGVSLFFLL